jgi:hypothetical protein
MRAATRGGGEVIKLELGITVYPPRQEGGRWRAVWHEDGYLVNPMLAGVHWQAGDRPLPVPKVTVAGESAMLVDPSEVPSKVDVGNLGRALAEDRPQGEAGANPLGLIFPSSTGKYWRSSNFNRRILQPAYQKAGWRDSSGAGQWTWHSLRHVFRRSSRTR